MHSPAHLLLIERLIEILMVLVRAIDLAADAKPNVRRACARLLLSRLAAHLTRLRERNRAPDPEPGPVSPLNAPSVPRVRPLAASPIARARQHTMATARPAVTGPPRTPSRLKLRLAAVPALA